MDLEGLGKAAGTFFGGVGSAGLFWRVWRQMDRVKQAKSEGDADVAKASSDALVDTIRRYEQLADAAERRAERAEQREQSAVLRADRAEERERAADQRAREAESKVADLEKRIAKLEAIVAGRRAND